MAAHRAFISVLTLFLGCVAVPDAYRMPQATYPPRIERVAVGGFDREVFRQTSGSSGYAVWDGRTSSNASVVGPGITGTASGDGSWGGFAGTESWSGEYRPVSDLLAFKNLLENTRCIRVVEAAQREATAGDLLTLIGDTSARKRTGIPLALTNAPQVLTLVGIFGVPVHEGADGFARVRLYRSGRFERQLTATTRLLFWTTIYTFRNDEAEAAELARQMALRDLADAVAQDLCAQD